MNTEKNCYHCGLPITDNECLEVTILGEAQAMCCPGCQAVAHTIVNIGMERYYQHREPGKPGAMQAVDLIPECLSGLKDWDTPALQEPYVHSVATNQKEITLLINNITCAACVWLIETQLKHITGIIHCSVNMSSHRAQIKWDDQRISLSGIIKAIAAVGYQAEPYSPQQQEIRIKQENKRALTRIGVAGLAAMQVMMYATGLYLGAFSDMNPQHQYFLRWVSALVCTPVYFYSGIPFLQGALRSLKSRHLSMDVPIALALTLAFFSSLWATLTSGPEVYFDSVCMFVFFLSIGRYLEMRARHRSQETSIRMSHSKILTARTLTKDQQPVLIPADQLTINDRVLVKAGEVIPGDGIVESGESSVNETMLTGESLPRLKTHGDAVIGGTLNVEQPLIITIQHQPKNSTLSTLRRLLERAEADKPQTFQLADRIASYFVLATLIISMLVFAYWWFNAPPDAFWITLSVLVVTCPCALSLATPTAITAATSALANLGFLSTRSHTLETLRIITDVVFDKTGTLTLGTFSLTETRILNGVDLETTNALAASLEAVSEHPIAHAFHDIPQKRPINTPMVFPNQGVEAIWKEQTVRIGKPEFANFGVHIMPPADSNMADHGQWILLATKTEPMAWFYITDRLRPGGPELIQQLREQGIRCHILSGDGSGHAEQLGQDLDIHQVISNATPQQKLAYLQTLQKDGQTVLMVGDGLNDAPVLAQANVSIAVAGASDLANIAADGILLGESLKPLQQATKVALTTHQIIRQNLTWAIAYNVIALPLAASGIIPPWASAIGMSASSLLVVLNALRISKLGNTLSLRY